METTRNEADRVESGNSPPTAALEAQIQAELAARRGVLNLARKTSLGHAREIGRLLVQLRDATERGEFVSAVSRCGLSERSAYRYIRLHEQSCHVAGTVTTIRDAEAAVTTPKSSKLLECGCDEATHTICPECDAAYPPEDDNLLEAVTSKVGNPSVRPLPLDTRSDEEREAADREAQRAACDRRNARFRELMAGVQASPDLIEKWRTAWASLNVTEAEVEEVERAVETWQESLRILNAARQRVLDVYPKRLPDSAAQMDGNLDGIGKAFRRLFETGGIGNGTLAVPTASG